MRAVVQRVAGCQVSVDGREISAIGRGLLVLLGVGPDDGESDVESMSEKITNLRIFEDEQGKMNLSLIDVKGEMMVVSQFTLYADCRRGRRPSFTAAAPPEHGEARYNSFVESVTARGVTICTGAFGARMMVELRNDGPVTIALDSKDL